MEAGGFGEQVLKGGAEGGFVFDVLGAELVERFVIVFDGGAAGFSAFGRGIIGDDHNVSMRRLLGAGVEFVPPLQGLACFGSIPRVPLRSTLGY